MKREPLTKEMVERGTVKHAPCLGQEMIISLMVNGVRTRGPCSKCYAWRQCCRTRLGTAEESAVVANDVSGVG